MTDRRPLHGIVRFQTYCRRYLVRRKAETYLSESIPKLVRRFLSKKYRRTFLLQFPSLRSSIRHCTPLKCAQVSYLGVVMTSVQKYSIVNILNAKATSRAFIMRYLDITKHRLKRLFRKQREGKQFMDIAYRPHCVDDRGYETITEQIMRHKTTDENPLTMSELSTFVNDVYYDTARRRGQFLVSRESFALRILLSMWGHRVHDRTQLCYSLS